MPDTRIEIVDTHVHAEPWFLTRDAKTPAPGTFDHLFDGCRHRTRLVVSSTGRNQVLVERGNVVDVKLLARLIGPFPDKFVGAVMVDPHDIDDALEAIDLGITKLGFRMIGELVQYIHNWRTDGPMILPVVQRAIELDVPMDFHSSSEDHAEGVARLAEKFPRAKFIIAHASGGRAWRRGLEQVKHLPNVWVEVMDGAQPRELEGVLAAVGPARMTYGTDFGIHAGPELRYEHGNHLLDKLAGLKVKEGDIERICSGNARQLLRL